MLAQAINLFIDKTGFFNQTYKSYSLETGEEITIDTLSGHIVVCLCTPWEEGAPGEVKEWHWFDSQKEADDFVQTMI